MTDRVTIELTKDEALVLFEFLSRFNKADHENVYEDHAEQKTLWIVEGQLEKTLVEPFMPNYIDLVRQSRNKIRNEN